MIGDINADPLTFKELISISPEFLADSLLGRKVKLNALQFENNFMQAHYISTYRLEHDFSCVQYFNFLGNYHFEMEQFGKSLNPHKTYIYVPFNVFDNGYLDNLSWLLKRSRNLQTIDTLPNVKKQRFPKEACFLPSHDPEGEHPFSKKFMDEKIVMSPNLNVTGYIIGVSTEKQNAYLNYIPAKKMVTQINLYIMPTGITY